MNLLEYQKQAITTKIYDDSVAIPYVVLGICGEVGELYEKLVLVTKGEDVSPMLIKKEIGDVAWYLAAWAEENGTDLQEIYQYSVQRLGSDVGAEMDSLILCSGRIAEYTKKALRDDFALISQGKFPEDKLMKIHLNVAMLTDVLFNICVHQDWELSTILEENVAKLKSRADRNKLKGSGDER